MVSFFKALEDSFAAPGEPMDANATSKGERNANHGNLEDGPFARSQPGYIGSDGRFARFATPEDGTRAQEALLAKNYQGMSPAKVVQKYAPLQAVGGDNTEQQVRNYVGYAAARLGIDPDQPIPPERRKEFAAAMREFETGKTQKIKFKPYAGSLPQGSGGKTVANATQTPTMVEDITKVGATTAEKTALQAPYQGVANPFETAGVKGAVSTVQNRASLADAILQQATQKSEVLRADALAELDSTVAAKRSLYEHGKETTQALINAATPIFQQRKQIQDRRSEVARMNPFVALVKGVIDPNYNSDALESRDNILKGDLSLLDEEYSHQSKLHEQLVGLTTAESADQQMLYNAQLANVSEDTRLAIQSYEMGGALLDAQMKPFQTDSALVAAQTTQRNNFLSTATTGQINELLQRADVSDSQTVEVAGMPFSKQMIQEEQSRRVEQGYHMASMKLGMQSQNDAIVEQGQERFMKGMNLTDVQQAITNGGIIDGVQFDLTKLGARAAQLREVSQGQAQDAVMQTAGGQWSGLVSNYAQSTKGYGARLGSMFGVVPDQFNIQFRQETNRLVQISSQVKQLTQSGQHEAARQLVASTLPEIQGMFDRRDKMVDDMVTRWAGGNKDLKAIGSSWAQGTQVEPGAAVRGLIYMARNGPPAGMQFSGTSAKIFNTIRSETQKWDNQQVGDDKLKGSKGDRDAVLIQQIQGKLGNLFNSDMLTGILQRAPQTAGMISTNGKRHPFSMVSQESMNTAIDQGDEQGYKVVAQQLTGGNVGTLKQILAEGPKGETWTKLAPTLKGDEQKFGTWVERLKSAQTQGMYQVLDSFRTDAMPFAPSTMLKDLMSRPEFYQAAKNQGLMQERGSMGGFVTSAASSGGFGNEVQNYTTRAINAFNTYRGQKIDSLATKGNALRRQPVARAHFLLKSIPGLTDDDETYLLNAVKGAMWQPSNTELAIAQGERGQSPHDSGGFISKKQWQSIEGTILNQKFDDPRAESLRKKVAPVWKQYHESTEKLIGSSWFGGE